MDPKFVKEQLAKHVMVGDFRDPLKLIQRLLDDQKRYPDKIISGEHGAWSVSYSYTPATGRIFSARLRQRSSKDRDWTVMGQMAKAIGAPEEAMPSTIKTAPEASHYWHWDAPVAVSDEDINKVRAEVRAKMGS